jgi:hypothetical protein
MTIVHSLRYVYFAKTIGNLLVQLVGPTSNSISTFIFHSVLYYYFFQYLMTYVFWSPTKTINFVGCSWLIDIKSVRSISYVFFCLKSKGLSPTYSTFLVSSHDQLTTNIHWPWYWTVHVYVVIHFCDRVWSFRAEASLCKVFCRLFVYMFQLKIQLSREEGWNSINRFNPPHLCVHFKPGRGFLTSYVVVFFVFSEFS